MTTLANYITDCRRLLHDATGVFWSDSELTDYINDARNSVVSDTGCYRTLQTYTLPSGQETYLYSALPSGNSTITVINITVIWGNERIALDYKPFSLFNAQDRFFTSYNSRPGIFTVYGQSGVYIRPIPDQNYTSEWDTVITPPALVNTTDADVLLYPYTAPVPFYACWKAKFKEQSLIDAENFIKTYRLQVLKCLSTSIVHRIPTLYGGYNGYAP